MSKSPIKAFRWISKKFNENELTKNYKFGAYLRYIKFNLDQILFKKERIYPFLGNTKFYAKKGLSGIVPNIYFGLHEFEEMSFFLHYLNQDDTFLDIGSNVGAYTILASGESKCRSIAIEPIPNTFNYLKRNIELNALNEKVKLFNVGVSDKRGKLFFTNNKDSMNHVVEKGSPNSIEVQVFPIDELIDEKVDFIKIDVEGYEKFVLNGANRLLGEQDLNVVQIEINSLGDKFNSYNQDIHDTLIYYGFKPYKYYPFRRKLRELSTYRTDQFNTVYIKNIALAKDRVEKSAKIKVRNFIY